jgi:4-hydroxy-3-methylbut-2-en-1-yl diphosphate reductase
MIVRVADKCGFCHGVRTAIKTAEEALNRTEGCVCSLGPVIHNSDEVERLEKKGLRVIDTLQQGQDQIVLIRSHGAAPREINTLRDLGAEIVDATCVLVKRLQQIAKQLEDEGYQLLIIGEENHPEVQAVMGCVEKALVIGCQQDLNKIPAYAKLGIVSQTTQDPDYVAEVLGNIEKHDYRELRIINTLCKESCKRQKAAAHLCQQVDIMFVLGGLNSANTTRLAQICRKLNPKTFHLQSFRDLDTSLLAGIQTAGVTAGASTPDWIINEFVQNLEILDSRESL